MYINIKQIEVRGCDYMYSVEAAFLPKFIFLLAIPLLLLFLFREIMGKWLKVEKKKGSSYNHVNEKHEKVDWTIRFTCLFVTLLAFLIDFMISQFDKKQCSEGIQKSPAFSWLCSELPAVVNHHH